MSDMTHAEKLRVLAEWLDNKDAEEGRQGKSEIQVDLRAIADLLDAMGWRDEPPSSPGDWVRYRLVTCLHTDDKDIKLFHIGPNESLMAHEPGDRWLKLPEAKR